MALMWRRYKMTLRSFKGHFKVKVNKLIILDFFSKSKGFLPLKTMFRYGLLEYSNHFECLGGSIGDFEDDV